MRTVLLVVGFLAAASAAAAEKGVVIEPREKWSNLFAGQEVDLHFAVKAAEKWQGQAIWGFSTGAIHATVPTLTGEAEITATPDKPGDLSVHFRVPETREGVILRAQVTVILPGAVFRPGEVKDSVIYEKRLWIFPHDPFAGRKKWLEDLRIQLFDPEKTTAPAFEKMGIPFTPTNNPDAIAGMKGGLLIIGEGVSFKDYPGLAPALIKAAAAGLPVLCLAPREGTIPIPGADNPRLPAPERLSFRRQEVISEFDKWLDADGWPPHGRSVARTLVLKAEDNKVIGTVTYGPAGWPWLEVRFPGDKGRLVVCGFGMFGRSWEAGPTPRFLLARLLEFMTKTTDDQPSKEKESDR